MTTNTPEIIFIPRHEASAIVELSNRDNELLGYFLAQRKPNGLHALESVFVEAAENNTSTISERARKNFSQLVDRYLILARKNPQLAVLSSHVHSVRFGEPIGRDDPYWSVNCRNTRFPAHTIVDDMFYLSNNGGDDTAFETDYSRYGIEHHLFFHPVRGSQGCSMTRDNVQLTAFKHDPARFGNVREIEVKTT